MPGLSSVICDKTLAIMAETISASPSHYGTKAPRPTPPPLTQTVPPCSHPFLRVTSPTMCTMVKRALP